MILWFTCAVSESLSGSLFFLRRKSTDLYSSLANGKTISLLSSRRDRCGSSIIFAVRAPVGYARSLNAASA